MIRLVEGSPEQCFVLQGPTKRHRRSGVPEWLPVDVGGTVGSCVEDFEPQRWRAMGREQEDKGRS